MRFARSTRILTILFLIILLCHSVFAFQDNSTNDTTNCDNAQGANAAGSNQGSGQIHNYYLWIAIIAIIAVALPLSYFLISKNMKQQMEKNVSLISQMVNQKPVEKKPSETDEMKTQYQKILLKFLNYNENRVMKKLIDNGGSILQSEISRLPNMGKVKAHRTLNDMKSKGLLDLEPYGKTNKINLNSDVAKIFLNDMK
jgi:hypothetical protein